MFDNPIISDRGITNLAEESEADYGDYRYRDGETDDIWKDRSVGLDERIKTCAGRKILLSKGLRLTIHGCIRFNRQPYHTSKSILVILHKRINENEKRN